MIRMTARELSEIVSGELQGSPDSVVYGVFTDSRIRLEGDPLLFIALMGDHHDGHDYIPELYQKGVRTFLVMREIQLPGDATLIKVRNTLEAMQDLAAWQRKQFRGKVIAITGSNGKTIVKEWLSSLLSVRYSISKNPKSYNSQVGVALSILQANPDSDFLIFEAGISRPGEMIRLARMLQPEYGVITNIGDAHQENFDSLHQKLREKLLLFAGCRKLFYRADHRVISETLQHEFSQTGCELISWADKVPATYELSFDVNQGKQSSIHLEEQFHASLFTIPFSDQASLENAGHAIILASNMGLADSVIQSATSRLESVEMRMHQVNGINGCTLINDYYNSDYQSVKNAIDLLWQQSPQASKSLIISDLQQTGDSPETMITRIKKILEGKEFKKIIGIGPVLHTQGMYTGLLTEAWPDTQSFLARLDPEDFHQEAILLKGARSFQFEKISDVLEERVHRTILKVRMPVILNNLNQYKNLLQAGTQIMGMVKAFSYGSGSHEIARFLAHQKIDYLAVAFTDEGIRLRNAGVTTPIMVMSPDFTKPQSLVRYNLEPEIFNFAGLQELRKYLKQERITDFPIHIKLDTGMHRLGFTAAQVPELAGFVQDPVFEVKSVFSHLAAAGDPNQDSFTRQQISIFVKGWQLLSASLPYEPMRHILNTAGIERFPEAQFDMVRLGIGLYGISSAPVANLESPISFTSYISQIHEISPGETIGYDRMGQLPDGGRIGIVPVGYADGFDRRLGNGRWQMQIGPTRVNTIGQVCMDMCMVDLSDVEASEGDEIKILTGKQDIVKMAQKLNTIPYEILTSLSGRITRIYEFD